MPKAKIDTLQDWKRLLRSVRKHACDLGDVGKHEEALLQAYDQSLTYKSLRDSLNASAADANQRLNKSLGEGQQAAIKLRAYIRSVLGGQDPRLSRHGMKPYCGRPRRKVEVVAKPAKA